MADLTLSRDALLKVVGKARSDGKMPLGAERLMKDRYGVERMDLEAMEKRIEALSEDPTLRTYLPVLDHDDPHFYFWGHRMFMALAMAQPVLLTRSPDEIIEEPDDELLIDGSVRLDGEDLSLDSETGDAGGLIITGDLTLARGNLKIADGARLFVLGDLTIDGSFLDESEWSVVVVLGDVTITGRCLSSGEFFVGGHFECPFAYFSYNHGHCKLMDGVTSRIFIESDHGGSQVWGDVDVDFLLVDEVEGMEWQELSEGIPALRDILADDTVIDELLEEAGGFPDDIDTWDLTERLLEIAETESFLAR